MNTLKMRKHNIPFIWFILLPLLGLPQKVGVLFGWLSEGSWLNFVLLLVAPFIWMVLILRKTMRSPFNPLLLIGLNYGLYTAIIDFLFWLSHHDASALPQGTWTFYDLMDAMFYFLTPAFRFMANILFGLLLGVLTGFFAQLITKKRDERA